jgi:two-component system, OmpR family, sensor kinase
MGRHVPTLVLSALGIPTEVAPRLFERFTSARVEPETPEGRRHYGIGLALVADVAAAHDGRVTAGDRTDGRPGAVLTLTLPAGRGAVHR